MAAAEATPDEELANALEMQEVYRWLSSLEAERRRSSTPGRNAASVQQLVSPLCAHLIPPRSTILETTLRSVFRTRHL